METTKSNPKTPARRKVTFTALLAVVLTCGFILSLIPILSAARYAAPESDDLLYGAEAAAALKEQGTLSVLFSAAAEKVAHHHQIAHGRFANTFIGTVFLGGVGLAHYWLVPVIMLVALIFGTLFFSHALLCKVLGTSKACWLSLSMLALLFCVHLMPSPAEGLFWFCGGLGYTLYYGLTLTLFGLLLRLYTAASKGGRMAWGLLSVLTAAILSGLGFTLMIVTVGLLAGLVALLVVKKRKELLPWAAAVLAVFVAGVVVQLTAPGVTARAAWEQELYGYSPMSAPKAIAASFVYAACMLLNRLDGGMLLFMALCCIFCAQALKDSPFQFRLPGLITAISFCLYATLFTASLYATSSMGPYRQWNVMYFLQFPFWGINAAYWTGWCIRKAQGNESFGLKWSWLEALAGKIASHRVAALSVIAALMLSAVLIRGIYNATFVAALQETVNGSAAERHAQYLSEQAAGATEPGPRSESRLYLY